MKKQILKLDPAGQKAKQEQPAISKQDSTKPGQPETNQGASQKDTPGTRGYPPQHTEKPW
ncbi:MAG TPA: hypothetical protein VGK46_04175 [Saprospiraceae bacterium]